ncbi:ABC transporter substrate-binding protein [Bacteriovorax sp. Seq25_V]|uniref:substrate-binding periplasmic protein n=1 Tax=Bacteriovorax sp. Seq25_V TaxID=1201288 RepID=UPI000389FDB3|nr:transporter substrate-binding domain-containing protein [Bacteriovorax sp. Seq25_V]EQC47349.1 ABC transporter, substrate-binding protein, family 3 [Bacteriovorax sp. Seq25_V]
MIKINILLLLLIITQSQLLAQEIKVLAPDIAGTFNNFSNKSDFNKSQSTHDLGREGRIVHEIFGCMGKKLVFIVAPYGRHVKWFEEDTNFDAVATVSPDTQSKYFSSAPHIKYTNGVSTLYSLKKDIHTLDDLKGLRVISFVGASSMLPKLKEAIPTFKSYVEKSSQELHSKMLLKSRVDAVISDGIIFASHTKKLQQDNPKEQAYFSPVKFSPIFDSTNFHMVFKDKNNQQLFNSCLLKLTNNGRLDKINTAFLLEQIMNI